MSSNVTSTKKITSKQKQQHKHTQKGKKTHRHKLSIFEMGKIEMRNCNDDNDVKTNDKYNKCVKKNVIS